MKKGWQPIDISKDYWWKESLAAILASYSGTVSGPVMNGTYTIVRQQTGGNGVVTGNCLDQLEEEIRARTK